MGEDRLVPSGHRRLASLAGVLMVAAILGPSGSVRAGEDGRRHRLSLDSENQVFTAHLETSGDGGKSWVDALGERIVFAFVGEGQVRGPLSCTTPASGECTVTVVSADPGGSLLVARFGNLSASAAVLGVR